MAENDNFPQKENINDVLKKYKEATNGGEQPKAVNATIPKPSTYNPQAYEATMSKETDPDLMISYEIVKLPSRGLFYSHGISEVNVEYMTSKDEDLLTTPSLIEAGTVLDVLLKRKIKTQGIVVEDLLSGDRNAIILFLRTSSYGSDYSVQVTDPRTNISFNTKVDLLKLRYKENVELPDDHGHFNVELPMRKKIAILRLLSSGEEQKIFKRAQAYMEASGEEISQFSTLKLKASVVAIGEKTDRSYIDRFIDAMPALDAFTIRKKLLEVSPDVDMEYEFTAKDGYKFYANLTVGVDFFFPNN